MRRSVRFARETLRAILSSDFYGCFFGAWYVLHRVIITGYGHLNCSMSDFFHDVHTCICLYIYVYIYIYIYPFNHAT